MAVDAYLAGQASIWVQPDGPNTVPRFLGCHAMGDITIPFGDKTLVYCPDPSAHGKFKVVASYRGEPGDITTSISTTIGSVADYLEQVSEQGCPFTLFIHKVDCGRRDTFANYTRSFVLGDVDVTQHTLSNLAARDPGDEGESEQSFDLSAEDFYSVRGGGGALNVDSQSIAETTSLNDIATCNERQCSGDCGDAKDPCDDMIVGSDAPAGSATVAGDVYYTSTGGGTWSLSPMDPFDGGEDVISVACFSISSTVTRWLVAREAVAGEAAMVAYSDDSGVTWTEVTVGSTNAEGANAEGALFAMDQYHIWLVTDGGSIFFSADGGVTWTEQDAGIATAQDLNEVWFADEDNGMAVGDSDAVVTTSDGGTTWSAATATGDGGNLNCCTENAGGDLWWVGTSNGRLYYSDDHGTTWTRRAGFAGDAVGQVRDIEFASPLIGYMIRNTAAPVGVVLRTIDGGYNWESQTTPTNAGLNSVIACDTNLAFAVGEAYSGNGVVLKISE
jgi:photosystem II stability/assembly factor-like uncharacterized protein